MKDEISEILESLREVQRDIAECRAEDTFDGDRRFQRLLEKESDLLERYESLTS